VLLVFLPAAMLAQAPIGTLEGQVSDPASAAVAGAEVGIRNEQTGFNRALLSSAKARSISRMCPWARMCGL
jgi:hypothetical protein